MHLLDGQHLEKLERSRIRILASLAVVLFGYGYLWQNVFPSSAAGGDADSAAWHVSESDHHAIDSGETGAIPPVALSVAPFCLLLACIALLPLHTRTEHWWENNWNRLFVSTTCALVTVGYYVWGHQGPVSSHLTHSVAAPGLESALAVIENALLVEYIPFITLLFALYVISGGIVLEGRLVGTPKINAALLSIGTLLSSFIGTTGAAMLLIRPLLRANVRRKHVAHTVVFFIFTVCNTGGCLLPIGDPPLFLGFLRGVPFNWTLNLWPMWLTMNVILIGIYFLVDLRYFRKEDAAAQETCSDDQPGLRIRGAVNLLWLCGVVSCVACLDPSRSFPGTNWHPPLFYREIMLLGLTALSLQYTNNSLRVLNRFNYDAIQEVAILFLGIFICMQPAVQILNVHGSQMGLDAPWQFFWGTGLLSSCLDNAPTYVVFFETARTLPHAENQVAGVSEILLTAISLGAVFLGAMTYIGNGPNLMIKSIAEGDGVPMPSFFGYMAISVVAVMPAAVLITWMFLL